MRVLIPGEASAPSDPPINSAWRPPNTDMYSGCYIQNMDMYSGCYIQNMDIYIYICVTVDYVLTGDLDGLLGTWLKYIRTAEQLQ